MADVPLAEQDSGKEEVIWAGKKPKCFCGQDWTGQITLRRQGFFVSKLSRAFSADLEFRRVRRSNGWSDGVRMNSTGVAGSGNFRTQSELTMSVDGGKADRMITHAEVRVLARFGHARQLDAHLCR
jgi:hypothetical protein